MSYNKNTIEKWLEYVKLTRKEGGEIYPSKAGIAEVKNKEYNTIKYFKEILHMEESIAEEENREKVNKFQKSIAYKWWSNKYGKIWESDKITDMIIIKIIEEKGFIKKYSDVEELMSNDNTGESESSDEHFEMILRNYWIENGYEIDIREINQISDFGVEHEVMKTKDFMEYYTIIKELDNEEIIKELKKWYNTNVMKCPLYQKIILIKETMDYNKEFEGRICKNCFKKEERNNEIELRMGYEDKEILSWGFIKLFQKNKNELEEVIKGILDKYLKKEMNTEENENEETTDEITETEERLRRIKGLIEYLEIEATEGELLIEKSGEEIKRILDEYLRKSSDDDKEINKENELNIEEMVQKLLKERDKVLGTVIEIEIRKLLEWGYNSRAILDNKIISQYSKLKIELDPYEEDDKEVKEKLRDYILELEKDEYDIDNSEKIGEILSPEEYEEWDENIENINEDEIENIINTEDFGLSQNSDSNSSLNIKNSYNLQEFISRGNIKYVVRAARIENAGNEAGGMITFPLFYGKEEEDVNDWIRQFEVAFTAIGKVPENNGIRQAAYAATCLKSAAAQWYNKMKELNNGNLVNWGDVDNNNDLKHRIKSEKMLEEEKSTREHALGNELQVDFYIEGLEPTIGYNVRRQNPADLNEAINMARREEEAKDELIRKVGGDRIYPDIGKEYEQKQDNEPSNVINKPLNKDYEDELVEAIGKMKLNRLEMQIQDMKRILNDNNKNQRNNYRTPINYDEMSN
ncbi:hypothetical protein C1646_768832 [Rhizophagus diaphanus]|nr:hypothetical protein C1646_768832 [Rhizophagus diaphanus] [Rhizophagus sp. MUCL 43196]